MIDEVAEQIVLDSGEIILQPSRDELKKITLELSQTDKNKKSQRLFRIFDNKVLGVGNKTQKQTQTFLINLCLLDDSPKRNWDINLTSLYMAIGAGISAVLIYFLKKLGLEVLSGTYIYAAIALLGAGAIYLLWSVVTNAKNTLVFETLHGRIPVVEFYNNNPNKSQFRKFINSVTETIATIKATSRYNESAFLPAELGEHRRLWNEGIISEKQYEKAKLNILGKH